MAIALADDLEEFESEPPAPRAPRTRRHRLAVPTVAAATAAILGLLQGWFLDAWAARHDQGIRDVLMKWDAGWMTKIAEFGYDGPPQNPPPAEPLVWQSVAFFPGYPVLARMVSAPFSVLGVTDAVFLGALVVSAVASLVLAWGTAQLAVEIWRRSRLVAGTPRVPSLRARLTLAVAVTVLAFGAPMSFIYWMPFSESVFGACAVWALVMVLRGRHLLAGVLTLAAGLTRITAVGLILTLAVVAVVELVRWMRRRRGRFPAGALAAPVVGSLGIAGYLHWANGRVADIGGYFAAQERGWSSGVDFGAATLRWLREHLLLRDSTDPNDPGYVLASWAIVAAAVLCAVSLWPLLRRWLPWQVWLVAMLVAGSVLGSDGIMHARPRLLLLPVLLILLPFVVRGVQWASRGRRRAGRAAVLVVAGVLWCACGGWFFGWMVLEFQYGI